MAEQYRVEVFAYYGGKIVKSMTANSLRQAERIESGLMINLNHDKYSTRIMPATQQDSAIRPGGDA